MPHHNRTSRPQMFPTPRLPRDLPPFWELEQLLREGFDHDSALAELTRRREDLTAGRRLPPMTVQLRRSEPRDRPLHDPVMSAELRAMNRH